MVLFRNYNDKERVDRVWYQSTNVIYSECLDTPNSLKTLTVIFKNGKRYQYKDVDVNDYVMFLHGGLDGSNGKALYKYIIPKYECTKLEDAPSNYTQSLLEEYQKTVQDIKEEEKPSTEETLPKADIIP